MYQKLKYAVVLVYATIRNKSIVDFLGGTYVIAGNIVRRIR